MIPSNGWVSGLIQILLAVGIGGGGYGVLRYLNDRRKLKHEAEHSDADTARILNSSAIGLLAPAREQVDFLRRELVSANAEIIHYRERIAVAETEVDNLSNHVQELTTQVRELLRENEKLRSMIRSSDGEGFHD